MAKVYVICTGGTISMLDVNDKDQYKPTILQDEVNAVLPTGRDFPEVTYKVYSPLVDSSEMNVDLWNRIADDIREVYNDYDGFVILHGTDTMAYTGSALSFMLGNLAKPVILTGAQTPLSATINDARENIINSIFLAASPDINEVCICFNRTIYRANRVTKLSTTDYDAYTSANYPVLGRVQSSIELDERQLLDAPSIAELSLTRLENFDVRYVLITPNLKSDIFAKMVDGAKAVIVGSYGDGNISLRDKGFLETIVKERAKGTVFINKSQCMRSNTIPKYDAGSVLAEAGMVSAGDQTIETLFAKLLYLFSRKLKQSEIEKTMVMSLRGELTTISKLLKHKFSFFRAEVVNDTAVKAVKTAAELQEEERHAAMHASMKKTI